MAFPHTVVPSQLHALVSFHGCCLRSQQQSKLVTPMALKARVNTCSPVTEVITTPSVSLRADLRPLSGSAGGETKLLRESGQEGGEREKSWNLVFSFAASLMSFAGQISYLHSFTHHGSRYFFLYSQCSFSAQHQDSCQWLWGREGQFISIYCSTSISWCFPNMLWFSIVCLWGWSEIQAYIYVPVSNLLASSLVFI